MKIRKRQNIFENYHKKMYATSQARQPSEIPTTAPTLDFSTQTLKGPDVTRASKASWYYPHSRWACS